MKNYSKQKFYSKFFKLKKYYLQIKINIVNKLQKAFNNHNLIYLKLKLN